MLDKISLNIVTETFPMKLNTEQKQSKVVKLTPGPINYKTQIQRSRDFISTNKDIEVQLLI